MRKATIFIVVALLLSVCGTPVYAKDIPPLPHAFYGDVYINGDPAPPGTTVEARGEGVVTGTYNPITTSEWRKYGSADPLGVKLIVQGDISPGTTITFYVNGVSTSQTYPFDSGETTELPLSVTIAVPEVGFLPRAAPPAVYYVETSLFGIEGSFDISDEGEVLETITATSADGMLTITIEKGTIALDEDGKPLSTLTAAVDPSPPDPPEDAYVIDAYDFGPDGATFEPPIKLTWNYDPEALPEDVDLVIAYYDEADKKWVYLPVERVNNTLTALVSNFTTFALIARAVPPPPPPVVAPPPPPPPPEVVPAPPPPVAPPPPPPPEEVVPEVPVKPIPWLLIGGIIAAVVIVILLVYFLVVRRRVA